MNYYVVDVIRYKHCDHENEYVQIAWREAENRMEDEQLRIVVCGDNGWWCDADEFFAMHSVTEFRVVK